MRRSARRNTFERVIGLFGVLPWRCNDCQHRRLIFLATVPEKLKAIVARALGWEGDHLE